MRRTSLVLALTLLLLVFAIPLASAQLANDDRYVVVLRDTGRPVSDVAADHSRRFGAQVRLVYEHALKGYSATVRGNQIAALRSDPTVDYVLPDERAFKSQTTQGQPLSWGLDRIDQRALPLSNTFNYTNIGSGVTAYILDSGIDYGHTDFGGRAVQGKNFVEDGRTDASDCDGHGTHVAGTVGGTKYGVAKSVSLVSVRVLGCDGSGYWSWVIGGIDWVTQNKKAPAVANMSLGGGAYRAVDDAVRRSIASGVPYAIAAGNNGNNACNYSPGKVTEAMTIGASDKADKRASFSNFGNCVDWYAPGVGIESSTMNNGSAAWNGTSMATPHTSGVAALYLQKNPGASPAAVRDAIFATATQTRTIKDSGTYKRLLFTNNL